MIARDIAHRDRRADAGRETARGDDADLAVPVEQPGALTHRQLALDRQADALAWRSVGEMPQNARGAGKIRLFAAALRNGKAQIALDRIGDRKSTRLNSSH